MESRIEIGMKAWLGNNLQLLELSGANENIMNKIGKLKLTKKKVDIFLSCNCKKWLIEAEKWPKGTTILSKRGLKCQYIHLSAEKFQFHSHLIYRLAFTRLNVSLLLNSGVKTKVIIAWINFTNNVQTNCDSFHFKLNKHLKLICPIYASMLYNRKYKIPNKIF